MRFDHRPIRRQRGMTLIELLVVISIMGILAIAVLPALAPSLESRRRREGTRAAGVFFSGARAQALATHRPVGVMIERMPGLPQAAATLSYVEALPPYCGDTLSSRIYITRDPNDKTGTVALVNFMAGEQCYKPGDDTATYHVGDYLQLDYRGHLYRIESIDLNQKANPPEYNKFTFYNPTAPPGMERVPPVTPLTGLPFRIFRQPVKFDSVSQKYQAARTSGAPLQLPEGVVVDLSWSGPACDSVAFYDKGINAANKIASLPVVVMFSGDGQLDRVFYSILDTQSKQPVYVDVRPSDRVYLLVGKRELVNNLAPEPGQPANNLEELGNYWITIGGGQVKTTENRLAPSLGTNLGMAIQEARGFARDKESMGGR
jgi:prepilin-type N-terminal cleavage/methylation domain-containing protein